ncbi:MAG: tRNA (adenosine(37)-N6)-threonylcarbamoyltransferase complex ATPase subunit type 1 TsaE [Planctomycetes bacterium]|nr:tRNA (adenosine(37)-N6)-threonylcarbamoyltransferase complex ATPase subunit type 1 TsaE [Planctomycetota bacterium]
MIILSSDPLAVLTASGDETAALGAALMRALPPRAVVTLEGELGGGKSCFVRGAVREFLKDPDAIVPSPTFTMVNGYVNAAGRRCWHVDLYRVRQPAVLVTMGLADLREADALLFVEWPDHAQEPFDDALARVRFEHAGESRRRLLFQAPAPLIAPVALAARGACSGPCAGGEAEG